MAHPLAHPAIATTLLLLLLLLCAILCVDATQGLMTITYRYPDLFPESFDWDNSHRRFLVGSTSKGSLIAVSVVDDYVDAKDFVADPDYAGKAAILGVCVDSFKNRVVVAVHSLDDSDPPFNAVAAYDLDSKDRVLFSRLDGVRVGEISVTDVAVHADGSIYATDSLSDFVWKINVKGEASVFLESSAFSSSATGGSDQTPLYGLNGIVYHPGGFLLIGKTTTGSLFKVDLSTREVHLILNETLIGADGMVLRKDGSLVVVSAEKLWLVTSDSDWSRAAIEEELPLNASSSATAVVYKGGYNSFILHSYLSEGREGGSRELFEIEEKEFLKDAADDPLWLILIIVLFVVLVTAWRFQMGHFYKQYRKKRA